MYKTSVGRSLSQIEAHRRHILFSVKQKHPDQECPTLKQETDEFQKNPAGYFAYKEHWSLDGA